MKHLAQVLHLALVDNFLAAQGAVHPLTRAADQGGDGRFQLHPLGREQDFIRHVLVTVQLSKVALLLLRGVFPGPLAHIRARRQAHGLAPPQRWRQRHKSRRRFAIIFHAQRAVPHRTAGSRLHTVGKAAIRLEDHQQGLIVTRRLHLKQARLCQQAGACQPHAHAQHLARAQMAVTGSAGF